MEYIFYNQYNIESVLGNTDKKIIVLAEPEPEAIQLYRRQLDSPDVIISLCPELGELHQHLSLVNPDLLIINPGTNPAKSLAFLQSVKKAQPALRIITIGYGTPDEYLDRFMQLGVSYHINRHLTRPQDVATAARQVLDEPNF